MANQSNTELARRWFREVWNDKNDATIGEILAPGAVGHLEGDQDTRGADEFLRARAFLLGAFPDLDVAVDGSVEDGDSVVVRWTARGTHRGAHLGISATYTTVTFRGMTWFRFSDGRIIEGWDSWNQGRLLADLDAISRSRLGVAG